MRPGPFRYLKPTDLSAAVTEVNLGGLPLAGGQSLLQAMRLRTSEPTSIVDLNDITELDSEITIDNDRLSIGALTTHRQISESELIATNFPWVAEAARELGDVQIRNRGTVLGNICWADPRANMAIALLACDATVNTADSSGSVSTIPLTEFFRGFRRNALDGRIATSIDIPLLPNAVGAYLEFSRQRQDLALCNVCAVISDNGCAIAVGGIEQTPLRLKDLEDQFSTDTGDGAFIESRIRQFVDQAVTDPLIDHYGSRDYKHDVATTLISRVINKCREGMSRG